VESITLQFRRQARRDKQLQVSYRLCSDEHRNEMNPLTGEAGYLKASNVRNMDGVYERAREYLDSYSHDVET
jgi:hypothetical protein